MLCELGVHRQPFGGVAQGHKVPIGDLETFSETQARKSCWLGHLAHGNRVLIQQYSNVPWPFLACVPIAQKKKKKGIKNWERWLKIKVR